MQLSRYVGGTRSVRLGVASLAAVGLFLALPGSAQAATQPSVGLGTATSFAVLAATKVENVAGASRISGDVGLSPGELAAVTGFPPAVVTDGTILAAAGAASAQADLTTAYIDASNRTKDFEVTKDLGGQTLFPGVYKAGELRLTGTVTLDARSDPNAVFIFQVASDLVTASTSKVELINGASSCNVFWQVTSSATLGSDSNFRGTILALTSIDLNSRATIDGRALARNGAVTLRDNTIRMSPCVAGSTVTPTANPTATPQVAQTPTGSVATGDGSTSGGGINLPGLLAGFLVIGGFGGAAVFLPRRRRLNS